MDASEHFVLIAGLLLVMGVLFGALAQAVRLPALTGYIAAGIVLGPFGVGLLPGPLLDWLGHTVWSGAESKLDGLLPKAATERLAQPVVDLTMALVLFVLGGEFQWRRIRGRAWAALSLSAIEAAITFAVVLAATWPLLGQPGASLLGAMAVAVAPATTLVVLQEYRAAGPVSDATRLLTALSNVWCILAFDLILVAVLALTGEGGRGEQFVWSVVGSLAYGMVAGHALILLQERVGSRNYALPLLTTVLLTIGVCKLTGVPFMLVFLVAGAVVANRSSFLPPIRASMEHFAQPAYVVFFVISGWHLDFHVLAGGGTLLLVAAYVAARAVGKVTGVATGLHLGRDRSGGLGVEQPTMGTGLLCQAGAAIALAHIAKQYDEALGEKLLNVILGGVVIFELVGPLLVKQVVVRSGEVRMGELLVRTHSGGQTPWLEAVRRTVVGLRDGRSSRAVTVAELMQPTAEPVPAGAAMDDVLRYADGSTLTRFPVVDEDGRLRGTIDLEELSGLVYDPEAAALVIADDLVSAGPELSLPEHATPEEAAALFERCRGNAIPVVDDAEARQYRGVVGRAVVLRTVRDARRAASEATG